MSAPILLPDSDLALPPYATRTTSPALPRLTLSEPEQALFDALVRQMSDERPKLQRWDDYYNAEQMLTNLGVAIPPELQGLRTVLGWPRLAVDSLHERLDVEGFRYPDAVDADTEMWNIWQDSDLDSESDLAHLDALNLSRVFVITGTRDTGEPLITAESPWNMTAVSKRRVLRAALQDYADDDGTRYASLYLPDQTITMIYDADSGRWSIEARDEHRAGELPVDVMPNRARLNDRTGRSEITEEVIKTTDSAMRTLLDLEISREFFAAPQRYILGASESAFQEADGTPKSAWETYRGRILALERDEEENLPQVGTFASYDPSALTKIIDCYAEIMASHTGLPPSYLGKTNDQPASADAIRMSTDRLVNRARRKQKSFEQAWESSLRKALAFSRGSVPDQAKRIETIWRNPEIPTPAATTDALQKQAAMGYMPPTSDVAGEALGYSPLQRARIERDRGRDDSQKALEAITTRLGARTASQATPGARAATQSGTETPAAAAPAP